MIKAILQKISQDTEGKVDLKLMLLFIPVAYFTYLFHEFGHWTIGELLGNSMTYSLNNVSTLNSDYNDTSHSLLVLIGGPAFTILLSIISLLIIKLFKVTWAYPFVFFQFFCRFFSLVFGKFSIQDEAKISAILEVGKYTIPLLVVLLLLLLVWIGSYILKLNFKSNWYFFTISVFCELLVIATYKLI